MHRWAVLVGIVALLFGDARFCRAEYVLPDGSPCGTCTSLPCDVGPKAPTPKAELTADHGDCHDCCRLVDCDEGSHHQPVVKASPTVDLAIALPCLDVVPRLPDFKCGDVRSVYDAGTPATGPPPASDPRAPPFLSD
ncbi:MAG: hypothetical protein JST30_14590 [Armatimonadetes bacterium]|nr:hypothetical protein [Armatimonadota bacterium]